MNHYKTFEEEVKELELHVIKFEDTVSGETVVKDAFVGFKSYNQAFDVARMHGKRLEVLQKKGIQAWKRTGAFPRENLNAYCLPSINAEDRTRYKTYSTSTKYEDDSKKLLNEIIESGGSAREYADMIDNIDATKRILSSSYQDHPVIIIDWEEKKQYGPILPGTHVKFLDEELCIAVFDPDEKLAEKLAPMVSHCALIPCLAGQMPEDFIGILRTDKKIGSFDVFGKESENDVYMLGPFIIYDDYGSVGYAYRYSYDKKAWHWAHGHHINFTVPDDSEDRPFNDTKHYDYDIIAWQTLAPQIKTLDNGWQIMYSVSPVDIAGNTDAQQADFYKTKAEQVSKELKAIKDNGFEQELEERVRSYKTEIESLRASLDDRDKTIAELRIKKDSLEGSNGTSIIAKTKNGSTFHVMRNINGMVITKGQVYINGKRVLKDDNGNYFPDGVNDYTIKIAGNCDNLQTSSGDVYVTGSVGRVQTASGDVECGDVNGSVQTASGDIQCGKVEGNCNTVSGDISRR